jgi:hypothetical protein
MVRPTWYETKESPTPWGCELQGMRLKLDFDQRVEHNAGPLRPGEE